MSQHLDTRSKTVHIMRSACFTVILTLAVGACSSATSTSNPTNSPETTSAPETTSESTSNSGYETTPLKAGAYISLADYQKSKETYDASNVVLFFNASWCSTCETARNNLESDLSAIPADLAIVLVDFDSETELKRKYGVTVQHTFVQIDANGNQLAKWSGSLTAQKIAENTV